MNEAAQTRFVVLGFPRSGTTLLARLLDAHPDISCPPETHLFSGAARMLSEQRDVEGPPIGPLTGLAFAGLESEALTEPLRDLIFGLHERIANGSPVWVEKTGTDIFHLEALEEFLGGHVKFICLTRNPLDVIASNMDLSAAMGAQLPELFAATQGINGPHEGLARAWAERATALDAFAERQGDAAFSLRYEDILSDTDETLSGLFRFMGLEADVGSVLDSAFTETARIGLGDFQIDGTRGLREPDPNAWRKRLPRAAASRIIPLVAPLMEKHGYKVPKAPKLPDRETAVKQFVMAAQMRRSMASGS